MHTLTNGDKAIEQLLLEFIGVCISNGKGWRMKKALFLVGDGDTGTLKKFKQYGQLITDLGYEPVFLMVRDDNLPAAMTAIHQGWGTVYTGEDSFNFISKICGLNMHQLLKSFGDDYFIDRG